MAAPAPADGKAEKHNYRTLQTGGKRSSPGPPRGGRGGRLSEPGGKVWMDDPPGFRRTGPPIFLPKSSSDTLPHSESQSGLSVLTTGQEFVGVNGMDPSAEGTIRSVIREFASTRSSTAIDSSSRWCRRQRFLP